MVSPTSRKIDIRSRGENRTNFPSLETEDFRWDEFLWMENERAEEGKSIGRPFRADRVSLRSRAEVARHLRFNDRNLSGRAGTRYAGLGRQSGSEESRRRLTSRTRNG